MKQFSFPFFLIILVFSIILSSCSVPRTIHPENTLTVQPPSPIDCSNCPCNPGALNSVYNNPLQVSVSPTWDAFSKTQEPDSPSGTPTPTSETIALPFIVLENAFSVDYERVLVITRIENPNPFSFTMSPYQLTLYDKTDALIQSASGFIDLIPPQTTITLADILLTPRKAQYNPQYFDISRVEVIVKSGEPLYETEINLYPFEIPQVTFLQHDRFPRVSGLVKSNLSEDIQGVPVVAVIYDKDNQITGGGLAYIPFLPAESSAPIEMGVVNDRKKIFKRVELYPRLPLNSVMDIHQGSD